MHGRQRTGFANERGRVTRDYGGDCGGHLAHLVGVRVRTQIRFVTCDVRAELVYVGGFRVHCW